MAKNDKKSPKARAMPVTTAKQPKTGFSARQPEKQPKTGDSVDYNALQLSWHLSLAETVDPFGWHRIDIGALRAKLAVFEGKTWNEVLVADSRRNHSVQQDALCKTARDRLAAIGQDDVDDLVSLRLTGTERIWGIRHKHILKILWWDPEHEVCPSQKKHS